MPKKILVVDDERQNLQLIETYLKKAGYDVVVGYDGVEALEKVAVEKPDMIVTDDLMPRMGGIALLKKLQGNPNTENLPVIMIREKTEDAGIFEAWKEGVSAILTKPFSEQELVNERELLTFVGRIFETLAQADSPSTTDTDPTFLLPY